MMADKKLDQDGVIITYIDIEPIKKLALTEEARE